MMSTKERKKKREKENQRQHHLEYNFSVRSENRTILRKYKLLTAFSKTRIRYVWPTAMFHFAIVLIRLHRSRVIHIEPVCLQRGKSGMKRQRGRSRRGSGRQRVPALAARRHRVEWHVVSSSSSATAWGWVPSQRRGFSQVSVTATRVKRRNSRGRASRQWHWRGWVRKNAYRFSSVYLLFVFLMEMRHVKPLLYVHQICCGKLSEVGAWKSLDWRT